ncbi:MAG TPA: glucose-6-phosphate dehydrogenase assembly protein OpcA [Actinomycetes bacterium]|jgi:glucose-6-phosphate dehydrogenase assembly protein OpcA|nr:glucose-6-phosphate dehydrogenase assembly protein OpcA [Actinomycetes bacterium]
MTGMLAQPGWAFEEVAPADIEEALERQRRDHGNGSRPLVRASVNNMVVVTQSRVAGQRALATVESLGASAPSRCVVLIAEPPGDERPRVRSWARVAHHRRAGGGAEVVWEEVIVYTSVPPRHLSAVVLPLLLPELPVFTWWEGTPPFSEEVFRELVSVTDRLIVDSATFADPVADLVPLLEVVRASRAAVSDCVWGRLTPWRELIAAPFNGPPLRGAVGRIGQVQVDAVDPSAGLELVGWLASRLQWRLEQVRVGDDLRAARYATGAGSCEARVTSTLGSGSVARVEVEVSTDAGPATLRVEATPGHLVSTLRAPGQPTSRRVGFSSEQGQLAIELQVFGRDRVFEAALAPAAALTEVRG